MINASQVQQAYTVPIDVASQVQNFTQQQLQRQQLEEAQQQRRDIQNAQLFQDQIEPLQKGTGTPFDQYANERVSQISKGYREFMAKNPRAPYSAQQAFLMSQVGSLKSQMDNAKLIDKNLTNVVATVEKEYPHLDKNKIYQDALKSAYYDEQGNPRSELDVHGHTNYVNSLLSDENRVRKYVNPSALNNTVSAELNKLYPAQEFIVPAEGQPFDWNAKVRPFHEFDAKSGTPYLKSEKIPLRYDMAPINGMAASRQEMIDALPEETYSQLSNIPTFRLAVKNMAEELEKANPKLKSLPERDKEKLAAYTVLQGLGQGLTERGKPNYEGARYREMLKQHELQQKNIEESRALRMQIHNDNQANKAAANQYAQYFADAVQGKPDALAQSKVTFLKAGLNKEVYDITASIPGDGMIDAKDGTGDKFKIFKAKEGGDVYRVRYSVNPNTGATIGHKAEKLTKEQQANIITTAAPGLRQKVAATSAQGSIPQIQVNIDDKAIQGIFK